MDCLKPIIGGCGTLPNFMEKTFVDGSQTSKSTKVFSLKSFPLYGNAGTSLRHNFFKMHKAEASLGSVIKVTELFDMQN